MDTLHLTKQFNKNIRWLQNAQANKKDGREILTGIYFTDKALIACDGFRVHAIASEPYTNADNDTVAEKIGGTWNLDGTSAKSTDIVVSEVDGDYPDISTVIPTGEPDFEVMVNPKMLIHALQGMATPQVRLSVYFEHAKIEINGIYTAHNPVYALIMTRRNIGHPDVYYWRPIDTPAHPEDETSNAQEEL